MRTSASVDADICAGRCGHLRRSMRTSASVDTNNKNGCIKAAWVYKKVQQRLLKLRLRGYGRMPYPPKNTIAIISEVRGYGRDAIPS